MIEYFWWNEEMCDDVLECESGLWSSLELMEKYLVGDRKLGKE